MTPFRLTARRASRALCAATPRETPVPAGRPFFFDQAALAPAGIHQQAERQRQVAFLGEIANDLRAAVLVQQKIVLGEVLDNRARLVAHVGIQVDYFDAAGKRGFVLLLRALLLGAEQAERRQEPEGGKQTAPRDWSIECHWLC